MRNTPLFCLIGAVLFLATPAKAGDIALTDVSRLELKNGQAEVVTYRGARALKLTGKDPSADGLALIKNLSFRNGTIDVEVAGAPSKGAPEAARGFIGIAFRAQPDSPRHELIYIRPTNGRADDQLRRNHSTQYSSLPDWPWFRLRKESPGVYESYADMVPGEWTRLRITVQGTKARLVVGSAEQPCLIVNDLKMGDSEGSVGLHFGPGTEGYFSKLKID